MNPRRRSIIAWPGVLGPDPATLGYILLVDGLAVLLTDGEGILLERI